MLHKRGTYTVHCTWTQDLVSVLKGSLYRLVDIRVDFRFSGSSVDLTEKDKSGNESNLTLPQGCGHL